MAFFHISPAKLNQTPIVLYRLQICKWLEILCLSHSCDAHFLWEFAQKLPHEKSISDTRKQALTKAHAGHQAYWISTLKSAETDQNHDYSLFIWKTHASLPMLLEYMWSPSWNFPRSTVSHQDLMSLTHYQPVSWARYHFANTFLGCQKSDLGSSLESFLETIQTSKSLIFHKWPV